jgi:hypothetical protein
MKGRTLSLNALRKIKHGYAGHAMIDHQTVASVAAEILKKFAGERIVMDPIGRWILSLLECFSFRFGTVPMRMSGPML